MASKFRDRSGGNVRGRGNGPVPGARAGQQTRSKAGSTAELGCPGATRIYGLNIESARNLA